MLYRASKVSVFQVLVFIHGLLFDQSIVCYDCVVAKCSGFVCDIEQKYISVKRKRFVYVNGCFTSVAKAFYGFLSQFHVVSNIKNHVLVDL